MKKKNNETSRTAKPSTQRSFVGRLWRCMRGEGTVEKLVLVGLGITMAAAASHALDNGAKTASSQIANRTAAGGQGSTR